MLVRLPSLLRGWLNEGRYSEEWCTVLMPVCLSVSRAGREGRGNEIDTFTAAWHMARHPLPAANNNETETAVVPYL
jgi:hypothetical protein